LTPTSLAASTSDINLGPLIWQLALHALPWVLLFASIGLVLALIACIVLARKNLLQRHRRGWHLATRLSYVVILLALPLAGGALGIIYGTQRAFAESIHASLVPALEQRMPALRVYLASHLSAYQPGKPASVRELVEPLVQQMYYQPRSTSLWERTKARWINELILRQAAAQLTQVLQQQLTAQVARVGTVLSGPDFHGQAGSALAKLGSDVAVKLTTDMARQIDFTVLDKSLPQVFADAVIRQFNGVTNSARSMVLMMVTGLLLLIAAEIVVYRRYFKPVMVPAPAIAPVTPVPRQPSAPLVRRPLPAIALLSVFVRCWLVLVVLAAGMWLFGSAPTESTLSTFVSVMGVAIAAVLGVPLAGTTMVMYALYRSRLDPDCSPAAFAWTYAASLLGLGAAALGCYTYNIKPGNSVTLLIPMIIVLWCGSFALCLAVRHGLLRSRT
jgi:hypothetical protein